MKTEQLQKIYGTPMRVLKPVIAISGTYATDFQEYAEDLPYNFISIVNNSNSYLDFYLNSTYFRILANERLTLNQRNFEILKIIANSVEIVEGDLIISVQKEGMNADTKAREDYQTQSNPINKLFGVLRGIL
jgi:hypothetical protein